jgi:hypothetical protein
MGHTFTIVTLRALSVTIVTTQQHASSPPSYDLPTTGPAPTAGPSPTATTITRSTSVNALGFTAGRHLRHASPARQGVQAASTADEP